MGMSDPSGRDRALRGSPSENEARTSQDTLSRFGRRRFVQGAGALGAGAALGMRGSTAVAAQTGPGQPPELRVDRVAVNKTGTPDWGNAINGGIPGPVLRWREGDVVNAMSC